MALRYVGRFATTRAKLLSYLTRKIRERGWEGDDAPQPERLVSRFAELGYVDDAAYAAMKGRDLAARGYGPRRVGQALHAAGISDADSEEAKEAANKAAVTSALRFAQRRRFGPYASETIADPRALQRAIAAFARAGHSYGLAKAILDMKPGADVDSEQLSL
ncbi:regulatory protein RecX [Sphingomicrobium sediminis]|uniref:Regulatory protein RecX n=1 Tax=Sphingomicrobium sediminis TaxID=2950949 RepID=A0A9X2EKQ9_9SPHN|nr:regulatory protein RecX [Sphingomicrobium sediminis]MCM8557404.1 recombination regulator RecX [Sphingomicrobium sediminis]